MRVFFALAVAPLLIGCSEKAPDVPDVQACLSGIPGPATETMFSPGQTRNCPAYVEVISITRLDYRINGDQSDVIVRVNLRVKIPFPLVSIEAETCAGGSWYGYPTMKDFPVGQVLALTKTFSFTKFQSGWRCQTRNFSPAEDLKPVN